MHEFAAGPDQLLVVYLTREDPSTSRQGLTFPFLQRIADDAARRAADGYRIAAYDTLETAGYGTAGGMIFNTGDEHPLELAVHVVYRR